MPEGLVMPERKRYIIGNWKMNTTLEEAEDLLGTVDASTSTVRVGIAPPYPWIVPLRERLGGKDIWIGAQHAMPAASGAYTGDVSVAMIAPYVDFVLIGHSEQRQYHPAPNGTYGQAVQATFDHGRTAILCVGEQLPERQNGSATSVVESQLGDGVPSGFQPGRDRLIVAYEPVWAIGTGEAATTRDAGEMARFIDQWFVRQFNVAPGTVPILYGGSANAGNAAELLAEPGVDGLLVGSASLDAVNFNGIIAAAQASRD
jgi:triosephosphate isomerase